MKTSDKTMLAGTLIGFLGLFLFTRRKPDHLRDITRQLHAYEKCGKILYMTAKGEA